MPKPNQLLHIIPVDPSSPPRVIAKTSINQLHRYPTHLTQQANHITNTPLFPHPQFANSAVDKAGQVYEYCHLIKSNKQDI
jgi:hypothetical protein